MDVFLKTKNNTKPIIGIFVGKSLQLNSWDPDSIDLGITGSEEAVIYCSIELAKLGFQVVVFADPPNNSTHSFQGANPLFINYKFIDSFFLDVAISWRMPDFGKYLRKKSRKVYFWPHDFCVEEVSESHIQSFDDVLWLSNWQQKNWSKKNPSFSKFKHIFGNGINPNQFNSIKEKSNPFSCIYASNYGRGLEILLNIWPSVKDLFSKATLDIYYGWNSFGLLNEEKTVKMREKINSLGNLDVREHGLVGHLELHRAFEQASLWTYPCNYPETFCITALKAQYAGAYPVVIQKGALEETVRYGSFCLKNEDYFYTLIQAMKEAEKMSLKQRWMMREFIDVEFTWNQIAKNWRDLFLSEIS